MWEANLASSHGTFAVRRILNYVLATIVAAFLWVVFAAPLTHAATDATWNGASIIYQNDSYAGPASNTTTDQLHLLSGIQAYAYVDPAPSGTGTSTATAVRDMHVIYFAPGSDLSTTAYAKYKTYTYLGPTSFTNPSNPIDISITPQNSSTSGASSTGTSSCSVNGGLGWIICPVTNTLATGMDWVFKTLSGFLAVRPAETGQDTVLFRAWSYMRSFANVAFVIAFLIIIYSQLTNVGINNYSIKKLLPRLIVAAILVNLSYYISSTAIDISNILGYSLQDVFIQIRNSLVGASGNSWDLMSWQSMSGFILSSGTIGAAGGIALFTTLSTYGVAGSLFLLLPALVVALTAVLVALVVMAARQAVITLLVIIAPLAFVAYLLPNTEKWFDKWRSTFMTLLVLFPAFSMIFGGSQLAAAAIIQNADSINLVILGMLVQVAPLFITPMLIKLSGSTVARIAGMVNNPNKGIIDRTRNWSKERADDVKAKRQSTAARPAALLRRNSQRMEHNRRKREALRSTHNSMADARWANSKDFNDIDQTTRKASDTKALGEAMSEARYNKSKVGNVKVQTLDVNLRNAKLDVETAQSAADVQFANLKASESDLNIVPAHLAGQAIRARAQAQRARTLASQIHYAEHEQQQDFAKAMAANEQLQMEVGGISKHGKDSSFATAIATIDKATTEAISEARAINQHFNLSGVERQMHARGEVVIKTDSDGNERTFDSTSTYTRSAAIQDQLNFSTVSDGEELIAASGSALSEFKQLISEAVAKGSLPGKAIYTGGKTIDDIAQGKIKSMDDLNRVVAETIAKGRMSEKDIANADMEALKRILDVAQGNVTMSPLAQEFADVLPEKIDRLSITARKALKGDEKANIKEAAYKNIVGLAKVTKPDFDPNTPQPDDDNTNN